MVINVAVEESNSFTEFIHIVQAISGHFDLSNIQSLLACMACRSKKQQNFENSPRKYFSTLCLNIETKFMSLDRSKHLAVSALQFCVNHAQAVFHFYFKTINLGVGEWNEVAILRKYLC